MAILMWLKRSEFSKERLEDIVGSGENAGSNILFPAMFRKVLYLVFCTNKQLYNLMLPVFLTSCLSYLEITFFMQ